MSNPKLVATILKLHEKTKKGELQWEETSNERVYQVSFPGYTVQMFHRLSQEGADALDYFIRILNENGGVLEESSDLDLKEEWEPSFRVMKELYEMARRRALGVEQALNNILKALGEDDNPDVPF